MNNGVGNKTLSEIGLARADPGSNLCSCHGTECQEVSPGDIPEPAGLRALSTSLPGHKQTNNFKCLLTFISMSFKGSA